MSEGAVSFDINPPEIKVNKGDKHYTCNAVNCKEAFAFQKELIDHRDKHANEDFEIKVTGFKCDPCNKYFETDAGLKGHLASSKIHKYDHKDEYDLKKLKQSDILQVLLPKSVKKVYDESLKGWIYAMDIKLPEGYVLYKLINLDVSHNVNPHNTIEQKSFMQAIIVKKELVK